MMKMMTCKVLAVALGAAMVSPIAMAQSGDVENPAEGPRKVQEVPRAPMPPPVTPQMPVAQDPAAAAATDQQTQERPMTSTAATPPPHAQSLSQGDQWTALDTDRDNRISAAEGSADGTFNTHFTMMDTDGDGYISMEEHREHVRQMAASDQGMKHSEHGAQADNRSVPPGHSQAAEHAAPHSAAAQRTLWSELDTDRDGRISSVESSMDPQLGASFRGLDADSDGFLTAAEYRDGTQEDRTRYSGDADIDEEPNTGDEMRSRKESDARGELGDEGAKPVEDNRDGGGDGG